MRQRRSPGVRIQGAWARPRSLVGLRTTICENDRRQQLGRLDTNRLNVETKTLLFPSAKTRTLRIDSRRSEASPTRARASADHPVVTGYSLDERGGPVSRARCADVEAP